MTVVGLAPAASAAYTPEPVGPSWVPDGGVHAVAVDAGANRVYVGGSFTGGVAALSADTGELLWNGNANGDVRALALGPNGSLLLGGAFTAVGGTTHRKIASVNAATGSVNKGFKGVVGGTVRDIVVVGGKAYFGGSFTNHGGMKQQGLGAVDATTGANVTGFTVSANGTVYALDTDGTRLFVGGKFTTLGGQPRNAALGSITLSNHSVDGWAPVRPCSDCNVIWDLTLDNDRNRVYTVGRNAGTLFTADKTTGATIFKNAGSVNGDSQAVTLAPDGTVYVGGHFVTVQGQARMLVAEFDVSGRTPVLGAFSTRFVTSYPGVWAMASTASRLYVGGDFTQAGSQKRFPYFAIFADGNAPPADTAPPSATVAPANGAQNVPIGTNVAATFNEPVQGVSGTTFTLTGPAGAVAADVTLDTAGTTATLNPKTDLTAGVSYTATLTGGANAIRDLANNPLGTRTWSFTTAAPAGDTAPPTLTATSPGTDAAGVAPTTDVTATFDEPVQGVSRTTFTLTGPAGEVDAIVGVDPGGTTARLNPTADLQAGVTYTARLTGGITDASRNAFGGATWSFTTAAATGGDGTAPTVTHHTPWAGAKGISRSVSPTAIFSEPVLGVTQSTFFLTPVGGSTPVSAVVRYNATGGKWVLDPGVTLEPNTAYQVTITSGVTDESGTPFAGYTWTFTTGS